MSIIPFRRDPQAGTARGDLDPILSGFSIEVMPRTAAKIPDFRAILPAGTRIYIAHIEGTPIDDMVATAARLRGEGFAVMPHVPARNIPEAGAFRTWLERYREAGVEEALVIAGGAKVPHGPYESALDLLDSGHFEDLGFTRLHVAGHPEGNRDIDREGGTALVDQALRWKQDHAAHSSAEMALVTQFAFEADSVTDWIRRIRADGITLPVHVGVAGPAKLQTLLKFAFSCGIGPSVSVLQKRARDVAKLLLPYEPDEVLRGLATGREGGKPLVEQIHIFPLGGIGPAADYLSRVRAEAARSTG